MTGATETRTEVVNRVLVEAAAYWGHRARIHMLKGYEDMAYETAYTAAHCARLALSGSEPITVDATQEAK